MKPERAMLLDVSPTMTASVELRNILGAHFAIAGPTKLDPSNKREDTQFESELDRMIRQVEPRLIFLVSICNDLHTARELLTFVKRISRVPVIVVIESGAPTHALELLELGAADFVTLPFQSTDILARAWKLARQAHDTERDPTLEGAQDHSKKLVGTSPLFLRQVAKI